MSDLEIIKKSADYLKSCGISLVFEETNILLHMNPQSSLICKNEYGEDISYKDDYLEIQFYPHELIHESGNPLSVFINKDGLVLGYIDNKIIMDSN